MRDAEAAPEAPCSIPNFQAPAYPQKGKARTVYKHMCKHIYTHMYIYIHTKYMCIYIYTQLYAYVNIYIGMCVAFGVYGLKKRMHSGPARLPTNSIESLFG